MADEGITVGLLDNVTTPDEIEMALEIANDGADERVTVHTLDGMTVGSLDNVNVPEENVAEALMAEDNVTVLGPAVVDSPTSQEPV